MARNWVLSIGDLKPNILDTPSSSAPAASASEYQPSVLSRTSRNRRMSTGKQRAAGKPNTTGKENAIFKANSTKNITIHTPGPVGKNKRTLDSK
ncbi:hypothetical protein AAEP93_011192 [Penicillium crustosum]